MTKARFIKGSIDLGAYSFRGRVIVILAGREHGGMQAGVRVVTKSYILIQRSRDRQRLGLA